jgi:hypothetical protein
MIRYTPFLAVATAAFLFMTNAPLAFACACCVDGGQRLERPGDELEGSQLSDLNELKFAEDAKLRTTAAFPEDIKGFAATESDAYKISLSREKGSWRFDIKDSNNGAGTLTFKLPKTIDRFEVDFPREDNASGEPSLIKEWRIVAPVSGDGLFKAGLSKSARIRLILQGRGNNCTSGSDFETYQLIVSGPRESFTFYGRMQ